MRRDNWLANYHAVVDAALGRAFEWGTHDCITFAADVYEAVNGGDAATRMRSDLKWDSALSAARTIEKLGGLQAAIEGYLGPGSAAWLSFSTGDLVLATNTDGADVLMVNDGHQLIGPGPAGITALPLRASRVGWKL